MRVLTNVDLACLKSTPAHLNVECKIAESRVSGKPTIIIHEKVFEVIAGIVTAFGRGITKSATPV